MNDSYVEINMEISDPEKQELLIAQLSDSLQIDGFEQLGAGLKMYLKEANFNEQIFNNIIQINNVTYSKSFIANENWNKVWESEFDPVVIDNFVGLRADFHEAIPDVLYEIIITPKMSFGTGHHATTAMMLESFKVYNPTDKAVIDFGTGTGVLAILAEKMHAAEITAIDYDDWSIANALENIEKNNCTNIRLLQSDHFPTGKKWDIILANINLNVIIDNMPAFVECLTAGGTLVISGILQENIAEILQFAAKHSFIPENKWERNNWLCLAFKKEQFG